MAFDLPTTWTETTAVVAVVCGVPLDELRAPSRGRGPKPRDAVVLPRKIALYITSCLSEADYAALGRHVGLSRDTVATHAAAMREAQHGDAFELLLGGIEAAVVLRLKGLPRFDASKARAEAAALNAQAAQLEAAAHMLRAMSDDTVRHLHPTNMRQADAPSRRAA